MTGFAKQASHLALADIHDSIRELAWYRTQLFVASRAVAAGGGMSAVLGNETLLPASWRTRPHGFGALMALYESNYLRLTRLTGDPARLSGERVSRVAGGCDLKLTVLEQCPYTTTLGLTHLFHDPAAVGAGSPLS